MRHCDDAGALPRSRGPASFNLWKIDAPDGDGVLFEGATCPLPTIPARIWTYFDLYRQYSRGVLVNAGGLLDQPNRYLTAMAEIEEAFKHGQP